MFGLSSKERLVKAIKNTCENEIGTYKQGIQTYIDAFNQTQNMTDEENNSYLITARKDYLNSVYDAMASFFRVSSPKIDIRMRLALTSPQITGLPNEFSIEYFNDNGISAGVTFAISYYAVTNRTVNTTNNLRTISMLNHFQNELMNGVLADFDN